MIRNRLSPLAVLALVVGLTLVSGAPRTYAAADTLPARLTDQEFWKLSQDLSEENGYFRSDNLLSNEISYPEVMGPLLQRARTGGVYLGVGPEQNFNYIVALKPKMVFITDIRRGNLHTQLMYKALFEMSADRVEFVARLFSRVRPVGLTAAASATELLSGFLSAQFLSEAAYRANLQALQDHLTKKHALPLPKEDLDGIEYVYSNFYAFGPAITYNSSTSGGGGGRGGNQTNYATLMIATDANGVPQSYLASEATFKVMKDLEEGNLLVPLVGNFGGPTALKAVGKYVRDHGAVVSAFYLSNVEQYLSQDGIWMNFCANVASMPLDAQSTFIRSGQGGRFSGGGGGGRGGGGGLVNSLGSIPDETREGCGVVAVPAITR